MFIPTHQSNELTLPQLCHQSNDHLRTEDGIVIFFQTDRDLMNEKRNVMLIM